MKRSPFHSHRTRRFTLVELLVVMGIIAILAGVIVASVSSVIRFAKRTKANSTCTMIQTAVQSYYTEYSVYPVNGTAAVTTDDYYDGVSGGTKWQNLTIALCGNVDPYTGAAVTTDPVPNTRAIGYLSLNHSDLNSTYHAPQNPFGTTPVPYFYLEVDTDYSGKVGDSGGNIPPSFASKYVVNPGTVTTGYPLGGVVVWCSCDQVPTSATSLSSSWAHTY